MSLKDIIARIDAFNQGDPNRQEVAYSTRLTDWVLRLNPNASEELRIAARGQHIGRWTIERSSYPEGRGGYLRWREDLKKFHAQKVAELMQAAGYSETQIEKTRGIILKKNIRGDADTQTIEDALCLLFLESQFADLRRKTPEEKMLGIVRKTWAKMSPAARDLSAGVPMDEDDRAFIKRAIQEAK